MNWIAEEKSVVSVMWRAGREALLAIAIAFAMCLSITAAAQAATPAWKLLAASGPTHMAPYTSEMQTVRVPTGGAGTYTLSFGIDTTASLTREATASDIESALDALPSISAGGGGVSVVEVSASHDGTSGPNRAFRVTFDGGPLAGADVPAMTATTTTGTSVTVAPTPSGSIAINPTNVGGAPTDGSPVTVQVTVPDGITALSTPSCSVAGQIATCVRSSGAIESGRTMFTFVVPVVAGPTAPAQSIAEVSVQGGGAQPVTGYQVPLTVSTAPVTPGIQAMWAGAFDADGQPYTTAGGHPASAGAAFRVTTIMSPFGQITPAGDIKELTVDPPPGFVGNPLVIDRCPLAAEAGNCDSRVGQATTLVQDFTGGLFSDGELTPILSTMPAPGTAARLFFPVVFAKAVILGSVRPDDFGVRIKAPQIPTNYKIYGAANVLTGDPAGAAGVPFLTNPTECTGGLLPTFMNGRDWQSPGVAWATRVDESPAVTGCAGVPFNPEASALPTSMTADSATGLDFDLDVPQGGLLDRNATAPSHLRDVSVDLPEGVSVNPSGATGLEGCSDAQMAVGTQAAPGCPDGSKIGTVEVSSPLLDRPIGGTMYLGEPKSTDPSSGEMFRLFVVARDDDFGIMIKLPGSATADPATGKLHATFENNPRLPFDSLSVKLKGGDRGVLAMPQACGPRSISTTLTPWSGNADVSEDTPFDVAGDCAFGFEPTLQSGMDNTSARGGGKFSFRFTRPQGDQTLSGLTAKLPLGLLASVKGVPLCQGGQAAAGICPASSKIGIVDAAAGSGTPFVLEEKGEVFLTEGYKGGQYGLAVKVRPIAGPFRGAHELSPIVVRQALHVDRTTAQVTAISDPFPQIHHGVPLRIRQVTVLIDRGGFMLNPSDCAANQVDARLTSAQGAAADRSNLFQVSGCASLPFEPSLSLALTGRKQVTTGKHPGVKAVVTQAGTSEAGIEQAVVRLPKSLALDPENAQALCEFVDGTKPDLESRCPAESIVGRARARTPLLEDDLVGNVYFVKNVRVDPETGNQIRTLPMVVVALRGEIAVNLRGESSTTKAGRLVNTFASVPDAPISQFNLNIDGGDNGILAVTRTRRAKINLCAGRHVAEADFDGHNGRTRDLDVRMKTPCTKKQTRVAKLRAKRAAAKVKRG
jgi:hypothetical protein